MIYLMLIIFVLLSVAFMTLFERKILGYVQMRKGPNKSGFLGLTQPFSDAIKLVTKEQSFPYMFNFMLYYFSPFFMMMMSMFLWFSMPYYFFMLNLNFQYYLFYAFLD